MSQGKHVWTIYISCENLQNNAIKCLWMCSSRLEIFMHGQKWRIYSIPCWIRWLDLAKQNTFKLCIPWDILKIESFFIWNSSLIRSPEFHMAAPLWKGSREVNRGSNHMFNTSFLKEKYVKQVWSNARIWKSLAFSTGVLII